MNTLSTGALCKVDLKKDLLKKLPSPSPSPESIGSKSASKSKSFQFKSESESKSSKNGLESGLESAESGLEYYKSDHRPLTAPEVSRAPESSGLF